MNAIDGWGTAIFAEAAREGKMASRAAIFVIAAAAVHDAEPVLAAIARWRRIRACFAEPGERRYSGVNVVTTD
jgi:hypothetical protein